MIIHYHHSYYLVPKKASMESSTNQSIRSTIGLWLTILKRMHKAILLDLDCMREKEISLRMSFIDENSK
jgi:hypothetical protein